MHNLNKKFESHSKLKKIYVQLKIMVANGQLHELK